MDQYFKVKLLGSGSFGSAWLVRNKKNDELVIKEISISSLKPKEKEAAINEVKVLSTLKHKNIVRYKDAFVCKQLLCICMEYANDGDLATKIKEQHGKLLLELKIIDWFVQILVGVKYIHSLNILHRDLKSQNIFLTSYGLVKIGDFGISRVLSTSLEQAKTTIGTPYYLSPEMCQQKPYNNKSDVWSLGVLLYELCTLKHPFMANNFTTLVVQIIKGNYQPIPSCYGPLLQDLVLVLLQVRADDRPSASQLLKIPALQLYLKSYLLKVRHHEDPVIFDSGVSSCADDGNACGDRTDLRPYVIRRHSIGGLEHKPLNCQNISNRSLAEKSFSNLKEKTEINRRRYSLGTKEREREDTNTETTLKRCNLGTKERQREDTDIKIRKRQKEFDNGGLFKSNNPAVLSFKSHSLSQHDKDQRLRSDSKSYSKNEVDNTGKDKPLPVPAKPDKTEVLNQKTSKAVTPMQKKHVKVNFIERNRNLIRTPPLSREVRTRRVQSTPETSQDYRETPIKSSVLRSRTKSSTNQKIPFIMTRTKQLQSRDIDSIVQTCLPDPPKPAKNYANPVPKNVDPEVRFPNVRKRAASLMSLANSAVPLKLSKRIMSYEDKSDKDKSEKSKKPALENQIGESKQFDQQQSPMKHASSQILTVKGNNDFECHLGQSITRTLVECVSDEVFSSKNDQSSNNCLLVSADVCETKISPKRGLSVNRSSNRREKSADSYVDLNQAGLGADLLQQRVERNSSSSLPQGSRITDEVKTKIADRLRVSSSNKCEEEREQIVTDVEEKILSEMSMQPLHSTMIEDPQRGTDIEIVPTEIEGDTALNKVDNEFEKPFTLNLTKKPHTSTYTVLSGLDETMLSHLYASLIQTLGIRKFNTVLELAKRLKISLEDFQLLQRVSQTLGKGKAESLPLVLRLIQIERSQNYAESNLTIKNSLDGKS